LIKKFDATLHILGGGILIQTKELSTIQFEEHPSPLITFLSSHFSVSVILPSPQTVSRQILFYK
jgi:hypothetical protein